MRNRAASKIQAVFREHQHYLYQRAVKVAETYLLRRMGALQREQEMLREAEERAKRGGDSFKDKLERERRKRKTGKTPDEEAEDRNRKERHEAERRGMAFAIQQKQRRLVNAGTILHSRVHCKASLAPT